MAVFHGHGIVWNPAQNAPLCRFKNGRFETTNPEAVNLLTSLGFESEAETVQEAQTPKKRTTKKGQA